MGDHTGGTARPAERPTAGGLVRAALAALCLTGLLGAVPALLTVYVGNPVDGLTLTEVLTDRGLESLLACVVWLAWAQLVLAVAVELPAAVRRGPLPRRLPLSGPQQLLARRLITMVLVVSSSGSVAAAARPVAHAATAPAPTVAAAPAAAVAASTPQQTTPAAAEDVGGADERLKVYVVQPPRNHKHDNLWAIAEWHLGDGQRYREIFELNKGRLQPDGERLRLARLIRPGWVLLMPADAVGLPDRPEAAVAEQPPATRTGRPALPSADAAEQGRVSDERSREDVRSAPATYGRLAASAAAAPDGRATSTADALTTQRPEPPLAATADDPADTADDSPWQSPMVAFAGGGVLLAGLSLVALLRHRRRQFRYRHPGNSIGATPPALAPTEKALLTTGGAAAADVRWLTKALRSLVQALAGSNDAQLPDVMAARMTADVLELVLTHPQPAAPAPWQVSEDGTRWSVRRDDPLDFDPDRAAYHFAPYPALVTVGYTPTGEHWLLDLERVAALSLSGDPERCVNLARFLAAELAHNTWSEQLQITLVGFGREMADLNPDRLTYTDDLDGAVLEVQVAFDDAVKMCEHTGRDVLDGRLRNVAGDVWFPYVLLIAPGLAKDHGGLQRLLAAMRAQRSRAAIALVLACDPDNDAAVRWQLTVDDQGVVTIPALGVELIAQQIPVEEAADLAALLAMTANTADRPMPLAGGSQPWAAFVDAAGAARPEFTTSRPADVPAARPAAPDMPALHLAETAPWASGSILPLPTAAYVAAAATTSDDVVALSPVVSAGARLRMQDADPGLDDDLAAWYDLDCRLPKLSRLGPITLTARGTPPPKRQPFYTEVVAYLATRPNGATLAEFGTAFWPNDPDVDGKTKVREAARIARRWLGMNPRTGRPHLPNADESGPVPVYRVEDLLDDAELFRRLRLRAHARGPQGIADLETALQLVVGVPWDRRRDGGYGWLVDGDRHDHSDVAMVVDVAHVVATHHLAAGEPQRAADAAQTARRAGAGDDVPLLDLVAACDAMGHQAEADRWVQCILDNHDAEVEEELPPRTYDVLRQRNYLPQRTGS